MRKGEDVGSGGDGDNAVDSSEPGWEGLVVAIR